MSRSQVKIPGPVAEDKDLARALRARQLLPALGAGQRVVIDFSSVVVATQSFLHALLSEAVRLHGEEVLENLEFRGCDEDTKQLISTVIQYTLRARSLSQEGLSGKLRKSDVPQADTLALVRGVVEALAAGHTSTDDLSLETGFSRRHVHYRLHAARVLGFVRFGRNLASITAAGRTLVATEPGSQAERAVLIDAIEASHALQKLCPTLLEKKPPTLIDLTRRLEQKTGLSHSTAHRRAAALLRWRKSVVDDVQAALFSGNYRRTK